MRRGAWVVGVLCLATLSACELAGGDDDDEGGGYQPGGYGGEYDPGAEPVGSGPGAAPEDDTFTDDETFPDDGDFYASYGQSETYGELRRVFMEGGLLDDLAMSLNRAFKLPWDAELMTAECGIENAFWNRETSQLVLCYELVVFLSDYTLAVAPDDDEYFAQLLVFILFHELGHAFIHLFDLPALGGEEDAADSFSAWLAIRSGDPVYPLAFSDFMLDMPGGTDFADEHSLNEQRAYNLRCWVYGSDPIGFDFIVPDYLPEDRAVRCSREYDELAAHWPSLLEPHYQPGYALPDP